MLPFILSAAVVILDQLVKYLIKTNFALHEVRTLVDGVLSLTHERNTGAAFSLLREHTWLLTTVSAIFAVIIIWFMLKKYVRHPLGMWSLAAVLGGAVGNLIDRIAYGYVIDMFKTEFINFAIFNVADIFITCGGICLCVYLLFFYKKDHTGTSGDIQS